MDFLQTLLTYFDGIEYVAYLLAFFLAGIESTIGLSMMVPGSVTVMLLGAMSAMGAFKIYYILPLAVTGAIIGDNISYYLGSRFGKKLLNKIKFIDKQTISTAEEFIEKHGAKSVAFGRFVPFVKETIPFVAGTLNMNRKKFMLYNTLGALGWAAMWPGTGYVFAKAVISGAMWVGKVQLFVALAIFLFLAYFFVKDFLFKRFKLQINKKFLGFSRSPVYFTVIFSTLTLYAVFIWLAIAVIENKVIVQVLDFFGFAFIYEEFNNYTMLFFEFFTYSAKWYILLAFILVLTVVSFKKKIYSVPLVFWSSILSAGAAVHFLKHTVGRVRPVYMRVAEDGLAFPSGHATLATTMAGLLIFFIIKYKVGKKALFIAGIFFWAILIYISRIYLGVHYLSDILGGIVLGLIFVLFGVSVWYFVEHNFSFNSDYQGAIKQDIKSGNLSVNKKMSMKDFSLQSPTLKDGESIPIKYTCDGENTNPELLIENVPNEAKSLALIMDDPDVPKELRSDGHFTHWLLYNIDPSLRKIEENSAPGIQGKNDAGQNAYIGPCPPTNYEPTKHRYFFKLYALDIRLDLPEGASQRELEKAMQGHILAETELMAYYDRAK